MNKTPDFLVIGAQKSGTTTLFEDLRAHPQIRVSEKESSGLLDARVITPEGRRRYAALFPPAEPRTVRGEVSTTYAMLPQHSGVAERAYACNPAARIIYIVRDPLERVISHHHHDFSLGTMPSDFDAAVRGYPTLVDNSRYSTQVDPWVAAFGDGQVLLLRFEDYVSNRASGLKEVLDFLGLPTRTTVSETAYNSSIDKRVAVGAWERLSELSLYRRAIRPLMTERLRRRVMRVVLPKAPKRPPGPNAATLEHLVRVLSPEVERLASLTDGSKWWDLEATARRHRHPLT